MYDHPVQLSIAFFWFGPFELSIVAIVAYFLFVHRLPEIQRLFVRLPRDPVKRERYLRRARNWHQLHYEPPTVGDYLNDALPVILLFALLFVVLRFAMGG